MQVATQRNKPPFTSLLTTKLHVPPLRPELVLRPRLIERLNAGLRQNGFDENGFRSRSYGNGSGFTRKLTLISAPAGFGKTTLLSEWVHYRDEVNSASQVAWLSLNDGDDDLARFMVYLIVALQTIDVQIGQDMMHALQSSQPPSLARGAQVEALLTDLINQINTVANVPADNLTRQTSTQFGPGQRPRVWSMEAQTAEDDDTANVEGASAQVGVRSGVILILDDYHVIKAQPIHRAVDFLLDHLPGNMHLVIATRSDPPLHLARLRGRGQLTELRQADLRFTPAEVAEFIHQVVGFVLVAEDVAALTSRTEGWIAGLQMAAVSMQGRRSDHISSFVQAFTGSNRYVLDYLVEEVLNQRPQGTQEFLLQTSILDRLHGPLCDAVCEPSERDASRSDAQYILEQLEQANLFIVPLDHDRRWYRYHHLFADLLRQRLCQQHPDLVPVLHQRASEWYERNGLMSPAIDHALSAGDFERAAKLIEAYSEPAFLSGEYTIFLNWSAALPDHMVQGRPRLWAFVALTRLMLGRSSDESEARLGDVVDSSMVKGMAPEMIVLHALHATFRGDVRRGIELSHQALELLPVGDLVLRGFVARNLGAIYRLAGDVTASIRAFDEAARMSQKIDDTVGTVAALNYLADMHMMQGQLYEANALYKRALDLTEISKGRRLIVAVKVLAGLGELFRQWNDLETATRHVMEALEVAGRWAEVWGMGAYISLARIKQAQGDVGGACEAIEMAQQLAVKYDATDIDDITVAAYQARLWVAQGNFPAAVRWAEERGLDHLAGVDSPHPCASEPDERVSAASPYYVREIEHISLTRLCIAQGRTDEALMILEPLLRTAESLGRIGSVIELLVLQALALNARGNGDQALTVMEHALSLAEPEGYVRVFLDEGGPMAALLSKILEARCQGRQDASQSVSVNYVSELLGAFPEEIKDKTRMAQLTPSTSPTHSTGASVGPSSLVEPLTEREMQVLRFLGTGMSNPDIGRELYIATSTVRSHVKSIFGKLDVHKRWDAVDRGKQLGLLN